MKVRSRRVLGKNGSISLAIPPFNGGLFTNGGFENGFSSWANQPSGTAWQATPDADTVQNSDNVAGRFAYQSFTLEAGATYEMSADRISGDAVITYCIDDADSGVDITNGAHRFLGHGGLMSYGITLSVAGTGTTVCDNVRLVKLFDANVVLYEGEPVTYNGEPVTYTL